MSFLQKGKRLIYGAKVQEASKRLLGYDQFQWYRERGFTKEYVMFLDAAMLDGNDPESAAYFISSMQSELEKA